MMINKANRGKFILRVNGRHAQYYQESGTHDEGEGESKPRAITTAFLKNARRFETFKRADAMRQQLHNQYGIKAEIVDVSGLEGRRRHD